MLVHITGNQIVTPKKIYNEVKNPLKDLYIIGEAFSQKQAWVEGSLETVENIIDKL